MTSTFMIYKHFPVFFLFILRKKNHEIQFREIFLEVVD